MKPQHRPVAASPVLFHPQPKAHHPIPMMRSPPPLSQSTGATPGSTYGASPYQQQQQQQGPQSQFHPAYAANFFNDPTAQMGLQVGQSAAMAGRAYVEQNFGRYVNVTALKHYFNVSNSYVLTKVRLVLFPWRHRPWSRMQKTHHTQGDTNLFLAPRDDINSPDMYIPVMAFVTYILLSTMFAGLDNNYQPELLGRIATTALLIVILEIMGLKLGCYLLSISNESQLLDLVAYSGYKFVGSIVTMLVTRIFHGLGRWVSWLIFAYCFGANAFFLLRSLKYVLLPENMDRNVHAINRSQRNRRTQFLFVYSYIVQFFFMWILSS